MRSFIRAVNRRGCGICAEVARYCAVRHITVHCPITERGLAHEWFHGCEYINPDAIAQDELGDWNDAQTVLRAAKLATERRETCLNEGRMPAMSLCC